jgi:hypothetical protein
MAIDLLPLPLPAAADASKFVDFGREVRGLDPGSLNPKEFAEIREALYKVCLLFRPQASSSNRPFTIAQRTPIPRCIINP